MQPQPTVIGLEGGPCSGKTTLINRLQEEAAIGERQLVVLEEAATPHIAKLQAHGIDPADLAEHDRPGWLAFEKDVMRTIHDAIAGARDRYAGTPAIIVADRCDIGAYLTPEEHRQLVAELGYDEPPVTSLVDQLYFLPTVAREDPERYKQVRATNGARYEDAEGAIATCQANLESVSTHPELHVAWGGEFRQKIERLTRQILQPETEGEIKFGVPERLAEKRLQTAVQDGRALTMAQIQQSYHRLDGREFRLRAMVGKDARPHYFFTVKTGSGAFRQELQRNISASEYQLLAQAERIGNVLHKVRYSFLDPDVSLGRRLWYADRYLQPDIAEWHLETDVHDRHEYEALAFAYRGLYRRIAGSAKSLIFM